MLALLAKEPAHGYELRQRLAAALGPVGEVLNPGQVYVTLSRLERAGLVRGVQVAQSAAPDKKVYEVTAAGDCQPGDGAERRVTVPQPQPVGHSR
jgi:DNA-binding PadR family transcriptional regulator